MKKVIEEKAAAGWLGRAGEGAAGLEGAAMAKEEGGLGEGVWAREEVVQGDLVMEALGEVADLGDKGKDWAAPREEAREEQVEQGLPALVREAGDLQEGVPVVQVAQGSEAVVGKEIVAWAAEGLGGEGMAAEEEQGWEEVAMAVVGCRAALGVENWEGMEAVGQGWAGVGRGAAVQLGSGVKVEGLPEGEEVVGLVEEVESAKEARAA